MYVSTQNPYVTCHSLVAFDGVYWVRRESTSSLGRIGKGANVDYRPPPSGMALSRVPGDDELYVGGYV